ncbi:uncharacterized protein [Spinacia oleracea]|uniref:Exonuclease domain-containing protein n=1 Tax=Spinacia oleracea TaxID=3562 RepID=A0ABM3R2W0_SPIOL|nr:uncharacterized protein LOC130464424 [Spinacia oleracea]
MLQLFFRCKVNSDQINILSQIRKSYPLSIPVFHNPNFHPNFSLLSSSSPLLSIPPKSYASDEFPVDETFLEQFFPKDTETEEEAPKLNWVERGWAPWEEILSPGADFARKSLNEGEEVALKNPDTIEAFKMLKRSYRKKKMKEMGLTEDVYKETNSHPQEIIEFPSVVVNSRTGQLEDCFQMYVRPTHHNLLSDFCKSLTGGVQHNNFQGGGDRRNRTALRDIGNVVTSRVGLIVDVDD